MKFTKITGENFKNFDTIEFTPEKTTCAIVGPNGKGKTTITQLIRFALTGEGTKDLIKAGTDTASARLELIDADGCEQSWERFISNTRASKVRVNEKNATGKALTSHIESITNVPIESLRLSSSSELIEALKPEEFSDFIMSYIPEALDYDTLKSYIAETDEVVTPDMYKLLEESGIISLTEKFGYEKLQEIYNFLFERRKAVRADLAVYTGKTTMPDFVMPTISMDEVNRRLEEILHQEGGYNNALKLVKVYNDAVAARNKQLANIKELEERLKGAVVEKPEPGLSAKIANEKRELQASIVSLKTAVATMQKNIETFKTTIANLDKPMCPLSAGLVCKTDKSEKKQEFLDQIAENEKSVASLNEEIKQKQAAFEELVKKEAEYNAQDKKYNEYTILVNHLDSLKKSLPAEPVKPEIPATVPDFTAEKQKLTQIKADILKYEQYNKDKIKAEELAVEKAKLDTLVKLFAPKGEVTLKVTKYYFGIFEDVCNDRASQLKPGFTLQFIPENGIKVLCETEPGRGYIPYQNCSSGERAFVIFLLTDLISCALSKSNILILDDLDKLDSEAFDSLMECIMQPSVQESYDHIIICAVNHPDTLASLAKYPDIEVKNL